MYFPYLRGRQYELLALRELVQNEFVSDEILPVIEPVKLSPTFIKTMQEFIDKKKSVYIILNPEFGSFFQEYNENKKYSDKMFEFFKSKYIKKGYIFNQEFLDIISINLEELDVDNMLLINNDKDFFQTHYENVFKDKQPKYNLVPDERIFLRKCENIVLFDDRFAKQTRNFDYDNKVDEFFSEDHLYYLQDEFKGFSDYSIVGKDFQEKGFAPRAVAIHIVYFDDKNKLRIRHFVSDSNEDIQNTALKFYEALTKLNEWIKTEKIEKTYALSVLLEHFTNESYPGLGTLKKLCIMHHIQLVNNFLIESRKK
ncbi:MAG: sce7725 family protein [Candidatus Muirbacterium halophilum]|nr:sce7725 family protein [Candidatus Muirbacterium halophilum]MCK9477436.1 sce7725 family protein [Candidatus Muirbacterium halophilum]